MWPGKEQGVEQKNHDAPLGEQAYSQEEGAILDQVLFEVANWYAEGGPSSVPGNLEANAAHQVRTSCRWRR